MTLHLEKKFIMNNFRNIIFDFGAVLVDWNPRYVYTPYFGSAEKADWFIKNICTIEWNSRVDKGVPSDVLTDELVAEHPEWEKEIRLYFDRWVDMVGEETPGMTDLIEELKSKGYRVLGLSNWARETFNLVKDGFKFEKLLDGYIISGDVKMLKPDAEIYQKLVDTFNIEPSESIFIDDNIANVAASEAFGIKAIRFEGIESLKEELKKYNIL